MLKMRRMDDVGFWGNFVLHISADDLYQNCIGYIPRLAQHWPLSRMGGESDYIAMASIDRQPS